MVLRVTFLALALFGTPAVAEDMSPWFGSEASQATQIGLTDDVKTSQAVGEDTTVSSNEICPIEGCPITANTAKYHY
jgi:hypothetical protein